MKINKQALGLVITALVLITIAAYHLGQCLGERQNSDVGEIQSDLHNSSVNEDQKDGQNTAIAIDQIFDTSALAAWAYGDANANVRMVGATYYGDSDNGTTIVQDDMGDTWMITQSVGEFDFLLLWISDNGTQDASDDTVIKVWKEAY